jgi:glutamine synthetase
LSASRSASHLQAEAEALGQAGVHGLTIAWVDNGGITRSRTVPISRLTAVAETGVGITTLFAVVDSHDVITFAHEGLSTASGDVRLLPETRRIIRLAGQPGFAWAPGRQRTADGEPWPYDQRAALERQVDRAAAAGLALQVGYELEFFVGRDCDAPEPAHHGPVYSAQALLEIDEFAAAVLGDLRANGIAVGQIHAEYGPGQVEVSLG